MKKFIALFFSIILVLISVPAFVKAEEKFPSPTNLKYINDYAEVLNEDTKGYLVSVGKELEDKTSAQAVVVIIKSLEGRDIESYANGLFRNWGIGQADKDNGLLILVAIDDRRWKVEVGRGLEGAVTDIYSARVMERLVEPSFREGDYGKGIKNVYSSFADSIAKEYNVVLDKNMEINQHKDGEVQETSGNPIGIFILLGIILLDFVFNRGRLTRFILTMLLFNSHRRGGRGGGGFGGGGGGSNTGGFGGGNSGGGGSSGSW